MRLTYPSNPSNCLALNSATSSESAADTVTVAIGRASSPLLEALIVTVWRSVSVTVSFTQLDISVLLSLCCCLFIQVCHPSWLSAPAYVELV